jgi:hypothetical protein
LYKSELIHMHQLLLYLSKFLKDSGVSDSYFKEYICLGISPHHIHKTKAEHKYAIFALAHGISRALADNNEIVPFEVADRLSELAKRNKEECLRVLESRHHN